jgi:uncharacterized SAM-binding protein YcdF (DUF218 family)
LTNFKKFFIFFVTVNLLAFIWWLILLFNIFPKKIYGVDEISKTENSAIIVLTGGKGRIDKGIELFDENYGEYLFISGVFKESELELKDDINKQRVNDNCCVIYDKKATNTKENALEVERWLSENSNIERLILVSSYYHLPRSYIIFNKAISDKEIVLVPAEYKIVFNENITFHARIVILEYFKVIYTIFSLK